MTGLQFVVAFLLACGSNPAGPAADAPGPTGATGSGSESDLSQVIVSPSTADIAAGGDRQFSATGGQDSPPTPPLGGDVPECDTPAPEWIWCDDFDQDRTASYFEFNTSGGDFDRVAGVGLDGSTGMRTIFRQGNTGAGWLHLAFGRTPQPYFRPVDAGTADYREIYWRVYLRNEPDWIGGGGYKLSRANSFVSDSTWKISLSAHLWSGNIGSAAVNHLVLDPASGTDESGNLLEGVGRADHTFRWLGMIAGNTPIFDAAHVGEWYCIEARLKLNDAGQSNGAFQYWIDGILEASNTNLNWVGSFDAYGINAIYLENYWNDGAPANQERYMDNFVVSTAPVGCL